MEEICWTENGGTKESRRMDPCDNVSATVFLTKKIMVPEYRFQCLICFTVMSQMDMRRIGIKHPDYLINSQ